MSAAGLRRLSILCGVGFVFILLMYGCWSIVAPTYKVRYRLTVNFAVDGVPKSASSVVEFSYHYPLISLPDSGYVQGRMRGHAVTVDLGSRGLVFVVDAPPSMMHPPRERHRDVASLAWLPFHWSDSPGIPTQEEASDVFSEINSDRDRKEVPLAALPMVVHFGSPKDHKQAEEIDPNDAAATLGPGAILRDASFQVTDDPVDPIPSFWPAWMQQGDFYVDVSGPGVRPVRLPYSLFRSN